jgi:hypothetical protein
VSKSDWKALSLVGAVIGLVWDITEAQKHKRTCPQCVGRDYLAIALDVAHLAQASLGGQKPGHLLAGLLIQPRGSHSSRIGLSRPVSRH